MATPVLHFAVFQLFLLWRFQIVEGKNLFFSLIVKYLLKSDGCFGRFSLFVKDMTWERKERRDLAMIKLLIYFCECYKLGGNVQTRAQPSR